MAQHTKNSCVCVCCNRSHFRWLSRFAGVKMDVTDEKLEYGAATSGTTDCESLFSFLSFFVCVCACPFSLSLLNLLFFVPVLFFFFFSGLGFLSIIPWMDRHVFFVVVVGGGLSCHIFIFLSIYILFLLFSLVEGKWNSIRVEWFRFREMFVNHASSTPRWTLSVRYSQIKRQKNREIPKRAKQRRKEDEKKRLWLHRSALTLPSVFGRVY